MDFRARELLRSVGKKCRKDHLAFDLDREWLVKRLTNGRCELTGLSFDMSVVNRARTAYTPSIDRIVAGGGYTKAHCRVVLFAVNAALADWGLEILLPIARALVTANKRMDIA
jgi:hypothetical protein